MKQSEGLLPNNIERVEAELSDFDLNMLSGLIRMTQTERSNFPRQELTTHLREYESTPQESNVALFVARIAFSPFYAAEDPEIVGFATTKTFAPEAGGGMHVDGLFVNPMARGRRLGVELMSASINFAREQGARYVQYDFTPGHPAEHDLFVKLGFFPEPDGTRLLSLADNVR